MELNNMTEYQLKQSAFYSFAEQVCKQFGVLPQIEDDKHIVSVERPYHTAYWYCDIFDNSTAWQNGNLFMAEIYRVDITNGNREFRVLVTQEGMNHIRVERSYTDRDGNKVTAIYFDGKVRTARLTDHAVVDDTDGVLESISFNNLPSPKKVIINKNKKAI